MPSVEALLLFLVCVALASVVQHLTAFAFGLVLLACVELLGIVPLSDATNACMVLALVNSFAYFRGDREPLPWAHVKPIVWASTPGVVIAVGMQVWLSANAAQALRLLLGVVVIVGVANLVFGGHVRKEPSRPATSAFFGVLSGVLGGLFSTSGPSVVYHLMRQPFDPRHIRRCLMLIFAVNNGTRLMIVSGTGQFPATSLVLCIIALPVAFAVTTWCKGKVPDMSRHRLVMMTSALLCATGLALIMSAARAAHHSQV